MDKEVIIEFFWTYGWAILVILVVIGAFAYFGSWGGKIKTYELDTGERVNCKSAIGSYCGIKLWDCENGFRYSCLTNVKILEVENE